MVSMTVETTLMKLGVQVQVHIQLLLHVLTICLPVQMVNVSHAVVFVMVTMIALLELMKLTAL